MSERRHQQHGSTAVDSTTHAPSGTLAQLRPCLSPALRFNWVWNLSGFCKVRQSAAYSNTLSRLVTAVIKHALCSYWFCSIVHTSKVPEYAQCMQTVPYPTVLVPNDVHICKQPSYICLQRIRAMQIIACKYMQTSVPIALDGIIKDLA